MITIHYDFTTGDEVSYVEGLKLGDNFTTHCLEFFNMDIDVNEVLVLSKSGYISRKNLNNHTTKEIRKEHNIRKILVAGGFKWL